MLVRYVEKLIKKLNSYLVAPSGFDSAILDLKHVKVDPKRDSLI